MDSKTQDLGPQDSAMNSIRMISPCLTRSLPPMITNRPTPRPQCSVGGPASDPVDVLGRGSSDWNQKIPAGNREDLRFTSGAIWIIVPPVRFRHLGCAGLIRAGPGRGRNGAGEGGGSSARPVRVPGRGKDSRVESSRIAAASTNLMFISFATSDASRRFAVSGTLGASRRSDERVLQSPEGARLVVVSKVARFPS